MTNTAKIESNDLTLSNIYKDFYTVPDFQREYVWQQKNVEKLLDDVYEEFYDEEDRLVEGPEYFIGSIVVCGGDDGTNQLIDGQKRLTTTYLALCAIRDALAEVNARPPETLQRFITDVSADPRTGEDVIRHRLVLQYEDSQGVLAKVADAGLPASSIAPTTASVRNILNAYFTIREFLEVNLRNDPTRIKSFYAALTGRVKLIRIATPDLTHALKVFETINDRGVGLNSMDLLKNLLFMRTSTHDYPKLKDKWKRLIDTLDRCREKPLRFLRYFILSHYEIEDARGVREDEIYRWFVDHADTIGIDEHPLGFLDTLVDRAEAYANFASSRDPYGAPNPYLKNISLFSGVARQHFVLLLAARHLPQNLFTELARNVENLFFTYVITREANKTYERNFVRWAKEVRAIETEQELRGFLDKHVAPEMVSRSIDFDYAFRELDQHRIQQYRLRYILAKLTQYVDSQAWGNQSHFELDPYLDRSVHIEHILPQSPTWEVRTSFDKPLEYDRYVSRLGNLVLLERTINTSVSNGPYEAKRPGYTQSKFLLTKSLVQRPHVGVNTQLNRAVEDLVEFPIWNSTAIDQRQHMLGILARRVWAMPAETSVAEATG